jgi:hypothetical protein
MAEENPLPWGSDGAVPIRDTSNLWHRWAKKEIWLGDLANGKYIPKVDDYVEDTDYHITYQVIGHNDDWTPILKRITPKPIADMDSEDLLMGQTRDAFRCFIDKSVMPHRLQVDGRCYVNARNAKTARVYRGNPVNGAEEIISLMLDQSGLPIGTAIPLQLCVIPNGENVAQYYVPTAYTTTDVKNGEFLYVALFDDTGAPLSSKELRATVTSFTSSNDLTIKAVTGIALEGPLMSKLVPDRLEVPLNLTLNSINLLGVINYNSGEPKKMNVDGGRMTLLGLSSFVPTQAGEHFKMSLRYALSQSEVSYTGSEVGASRFITHDIDCLVVDVENQLTVKLFPYPVWVSNAAGYRLRWFLLNLDRNMMYDVSTLVETGQGSPVLDPTLYGVKQQLTVALDLSKVNGNWRAWRFVQTIGITLLRAGDLTGTKWRVSFDPNQTPEYGEGNSFRAKFINQNLSEIEVKSDYATKEAWLAAFYDNTRPLTNPLYETEPVQPTHFIFTDGNGTNKVKLLISDYWNKRFTVNFGVTQDTTWYLQFVKEGAQGDLVLAVAGAPVNQVLTW